MMYFQNEKPYRAGNLWKDIFLSHLQPGGDIKSEDLAIYDFKIWWRNVKTSNWVLVWQLASRLGPITLCLTRQVDFLLHCKELWYGIVGSVEELVDVL